MIYLRVKIIDFQNDSISGLCPSIKTFTPEFRQRNDFEFRFEIKNLKSWLLPKNFLKRTFL